MHINLYRHISEGYSDQNQDGYTDAVNDMGRLMVPIELNENQQIVLAWLKEVYNDNDEGYFSIIGHLTSPTTEEEEQDTAYRALACLNLDEEVKVLAAFAEWGLSQEVAE